MTKKDTALLEKYHSVKTVGEALEEIADGKITPIEPELNESEFETKD